MKRIALAIYILAVASAAARAQIYLRAGAGFTLPAAGQTLNGDGNAFNGRWSSSTKFEVKDASLAAGINGVIGFGYMINRNVGVQLDANIGLSNKEYTFHVDTLVYQAVPYNLTVRNRATHPIILMPSLVLQTSGNITNIYCRMGLALPMKTKIRRDYLLINLPGTGLQEVQNEQWTLSNSFSLGYSAAAGVSWKVTNKVSVWAELGMQSLSVYLKQAYFDVVTVNGHSYDLSNYGKRTLNYSKSGTEDSVHFATYSQPFSSIGLNVGVKFRLSDDRQHSNIKRENNFD